MTLPDLPLLVLDTETTGFVPKTHRIIEYASISLKGGKIEREYEQLFRLPGDVAIPRSVQVLTRIHPEDLTNMPTFEESLPVMQSHFSNDAIIVGQNVKFDLGMLKGEGWDLTERPSIDTSMLASLVFPELESYSLGYVSAVLGLDHSPPHRALGDVRATVQLLSACWERLCSLPQQDIDRLKDLATKGPPGYRTFFAALESRGKKRPQWLLPKASLGKTALPAASPAFPAKGKVCLQEEPLDPAFVPGLISDLAAGTWLAVKNIEATVGRHPIVENITMLYPPEFIVSTSSVENFLAQDLFAGDELTLAMKLHLYPATVRTDLPLHGEEYGIFSGKLACTGESPEYKLLREKADTSPVVTSHQHLLTCAADTEKRLPKDLQLLIDDASMLEDTATAAFAWTCILSHLRGAAHGSSVVTKCADLVELWAERVRGGIDLRYLAESDLTTRESTELRRTIEGVLSEENLSPNVRSMLGHLLRILDTNNLPGRITWIETMMDGGKIIKSVPENIGALLEEHLYNTAKTTLLVPIGSTDSIRAIIPESVETETAPAFQQDSRLSIRMPIGASIESVMAEPTGKTILLVSSKRTIEDVYTKHAERLEEKGVSLICQGFNGGQSRMRAEFAAAKGTAMLVMTPWTFEGAHLPAASVDRLILQTLPFDHPAHAVVGRRASRYRDPFGEYSLPRLKNRLFRLVRTFRTHAKDGATVDILDDRLRTKQYGREVTAYLKMFDASSAPIQPAQLSFL